AKRRVEIAEGKYLDIRKKVKIKFNVFADEFLNIHCKANKKSWVTDSYHLNRLKEYFNGKYLYSITIKEIEQYKLERSKQVSPATVNRELATLKTLFSKAVIWEKIFNNPAKNVKFIREPAGRLRFLEQEEIIKLLGNCSERLFPIVVLAVNTGMRRGEILNLKWSDVNYKHNIITLHDTKNGEKREVYINEQVKSALIRVEKNPESPYIFCNYNGKPFYDIRKSFFTALKKSGIKDFHFHDLRHTFASQLAMSGTDINTIRELMGHKDIRMTLRYSHLSPSHKKLAVDKLGKKMETFWRLNQKYTIDENETISQIVKNKELTYIGA
ncbi:MAG: site-specific integrase, partial [Candidatus Omnitrophica bacterium]|nr:site-specific integrase [Candidatus Omnitrophota bacterium]